MDLVLRNLKPKCYNINFYGSPIYTREKDRHNMCTQYYDYIIILHLFIKLHTLYFICYKILLN